MVTRYSSPIQPRLKEALRGPTSRPRSPVSGRFAPGCSGCFRWSISRFPRSRLHPRVILLQSSRAAARQGSVLHKSRRLSILLPKITAVLRFRQPPVPALLYFRPCGGQNYQHPARPDALAVVFIHVHHRAAPDGSLSFSLTLGAHSILGFTAPAAAAWWAAELTAWCGAGCASYSSPPNPRWWHYGGRRVRSSATFPGRQEAGPRCSPLPSLFDRSPASVPYRWDTRPMPQLAVQHALCPGPVRRRS